MGEGTKIQWAHHTFNPWWGCTRVSPGCEHCYAESFAKRMGVQWGPRAVRRPFGEKHWREPIKWDRDACKAEEMRRVFCASMADVFEDRPELEAERVKLWDLIHTTPSLVWLLLTKRPENAPAMVPASWAKRWPANVWAMTTAEDQRRADERIPLLRQIPAVVRGLSCEPLLEAVNLRGLEGISWVICGGESGSGARPFRLEWARSLRDQCSAAGTRFFMKQMGSRAVLDPRYDAALPGARRRLRDSKGGDPEEWPADLRVREIPEVRT